MYTFLIAAKGGDKKIVNLLIQKGVQVDARDGFDWTPLHKASHEGGEQSSTVHDEWNTNTLKHFKSFQKN